MSASGWPPAPPGGWPLRTARLELRPVRLEDAAAMADYRGIPAVTSFVPFDPQSVADVETAIRDRWNRVTETGGNVELVAELDGRVVGDVVVFWHAADDDSRGDRPAPAAAHGADGAHGGDGAGEGAPRADAAHGSAEIGWVVHPEVGGRGLATEAAGALIDYAFGALGIRRLVARVDALNAPSRRVCEKLGMRAEAHLLENEWFKGRWGDEVDYALLAREHPAHAQQAREHPAR